MIEKWVTWLIPSKDIDSKTSTQMDKIRERIDLDIARTIEDIEDGVPVSFKLTNKVRRSD